MERLQALPKIDEVLRRPELAGSGVPRWALVEAARTAVASRRAALVGGADVDPSLPSDEVLLAARALVRPSLRPVINATGVVLHTNLGRAPLADRAVERLAAVARGYCNLEYEVDGRARGSRHDHLRALLVELCAAEAALTVNNGAAAVLLSLAALAAGREVIVSRGELIEIGGAFRVPDVMRASGARLVEVGTTNKTRLADYEEAIGPETALLLKVHRSNFAIVGFTDEVSVAELATLGRARGLPVMLDLGSGTMLDPAELPGAELPHEPTVVAQLAAGADVVTFSGDKLLGGPQAGVIVGAASVLERIRRHPLMRALRPDKLTLAALEATLELHRDGRAAAEIPTLRMLALTAAELRARAEELRARVGSARVSLELREVTSAAGGGSLPTAEPPSSARAVVDPERSPGAIDRALRAGDPPIVARIAEDRVLLDVRTIADDELDLVAAALRSL